jgi:hypothetical protein
MNKEVIAPFHNPYLIERPDLTDPAVCFVGFSRWVLDPFCYGADSLVSLVEDWALVFD